MNEGIEPGTRTAYAYCVRVLGTRTAYAYCVRVRVRVRALEIGQKGEGGGEEGEGEEKQVARMLRSCSNESK